MMLAEEDALEAERLGALPETEIALEMLIGGFGRNLLRPAVLAGREEKLENPRLDHGLVPSAGAAAEL